MSRSDDSVCRPVELPAQLEAIDDGSALLGLAKIDLSESIAGDLNWDGREIERLRLEACLLERLQASEAQIRAAKWVDVHFSKCNLSNAEISDFRAVRIELVDCRMTGVRCWETKWEHARITGGTQKYAQFRFSKFESSEFDGCDFEDADFYGADLRGCRFRDCNLRNAEMSKALLDGGDLRGSNMEGLRVGAEDVRGAIVDAAQALELAPLLGIRIEG